jgi:hypothetical protein
MPVEDHLPSRHSNQYTLEPACGHCAGIIHHESWCVTQNESVQYAYQAAADSGDLTPGDHFILHALAPRGLPGRCRPGCVNNRVAGRLSGRNHL